MLPRGPFLSLLAVCALHAPAAAERTDRVTLDNGDVISCDIKELRRGKLRVKTDSMDTVFIDWVHVAHMESEHSFQLQLANGEYHFGTLARGERPRVLRVITADGFVDTRMEAVSFIDPIDATFWSRINGSVSLGLNYTKASDVGQFNFFLSPNYRTRKYLVNLNVSAITTVDGSNDTTRRQNFSGSYTYFLKNRWFLAVGGGFETNDELGINLRTYAVSGIGRHLNQTERSTIDALVGLSVNHEDQAVAEDTENLEGVLKGQYSVYDYDSPIKDITLDITLYPNLTDPGRLRARGNARVRWEIVADLTLDFTFYADYDSGSTAVEVSTSDYGVVASVGYSL